MTRTSLFDVAALAMAWRMKSLTTGSMRPLTSTTSMVPAAAAGGAVVPWVWVSWVWVSWVWAGAGGADSTSVARASTEKRSLRMVHGNRVARKGLRRGKDEAMDDKEHLGRAVGELAAGDADRRGLGRVVGLAGSSMKEAGARSLATGRWLAEVVFDAAPHIPVRDLATLRAHHGGLRGPELAGELIRAAARTTATMGALAGAVAGAEELSPPTWLAIPAELLIETLAVVAVELKLVAELPGGLRPAGDGQRRRAQRGRRPGVGRGTGGDGQDAGRARWCRPRLRPQRPPGALAAAAAPAGPPGPAQRVGLVALPHRRGGRRRAEPSGHAVAGRERGARPGLASPGPDVGRPDPAAAPDP